jgi:hypothetical protein
MRRMEPTTRFGRWVAAGGDGPLTARQRIVILCILLAVAIFLTAWTVHRDTSDSEHDRALSPNGSHSTAVVQNTFRPARGGFVQLTLLIVDGDAEGWEVRTSVDTSTSIRQGDRVDVAYDPQHPGDLTVLGQSRAPNDGLAVAGWIALVLVAVAFARLTARERRHRSDS